MTQQIMEQRGRDREIQETAKDVTNAFKAAFGTLIERRDTAYATAVVALDAESATLAEEYAAIEKTVQSLESLLPARARHAQREADTLTLAGKPAEAAVKLEELREAERAPEAMRARQQEILNRIGEIGEEKKDEARRVFGGWYGDAQHVIRASERGLFVVMLNGIKESMFEFQARTGTESPNGIRGGLFHMGHIIGLTADERSDEWQAGTKWYGGRR